MFFCLPEALSAAEIIEMSLKCKAAILYEEGKPHKIEEVSIPAPGKGEIRVRMIAAGVCASDAHHAWGEQLLSDVPSHRVPLVLGHEGSAVIESLGEGVEDLKVGDHVLVTIVPQCKQCKDCRATDKRNKCSTLSIWNLGEYANKFSADGERICSFLGLGIFSEFALLKRPQVVKVSFVILENFHEFSDRVFKQSRSTTMFHWRMHVLSVAPFRLAFILPGILPKFCQIVLPLFGAWARSD